MVSVVKSDFFQRRLLSSHFHQFITTRLDYSNALYVGVGVRSDQIRRCDEGTQGRAVIVRWWGPHVINIRRHYHTIQVL